MKVLGVGLSKTGTTTLAAALRKLGYRTEHYGWQRFEKIVVDGDRNFHVLEDVDAATDIPAAYFYREIAAVYHPVKIIMTTRDVDDWWVSMEKHCASVDRFAADMPSYTNFVHSLHEQVYGSRKPQEYLWKYRFLAFNDSVTRYFRGNVLTMDITRGEGWSALCEFLDRPVPDGPFPWENKRPTK